MHHHQHIFSAYPGGHTFEEETRVHDEPYGYELGDDPFDPHGNGDYPALIVLAGIFAFAHLTWAHTVCAMVCQVCACSALFGAGRVCAAEKPNVILILVDDMGFSDIGAYGGEIETPHLDALAEGGVRYSQFYNASRCCPTRASLMTGVHPHLTGIGHMTNSPQNRLLLLLSTGATTFSLSVLFFFSSAQASKHPSKVA